MVGHRLAVTPAARDGSGDEGAAEREPQEHEHDVVRYQQQPLDQPERPRRPLEPALQVAIKPGCVRRL
jgi:hypothetical protein